MKKLIAALTLLALSAAAAFGNSTRYVDQQLGSDTNDGQSLTQSGPLHGPWKSIEKANASMPAAATDSGNVTVYIKPGHYSGTPLPASVAANGKRYSFIATDLTTPSLFSIHYPNTSQQMPLASTYLSLHGFNIIGGLSAQSGAQFDSVLDCIIAGNLSVDQSYYLTLARCSGLGATISIGHTAHDAASTLPVLIHYSMHDCTFNNLTGGPNNNAVMCGISDASKLYHRQLVDSLLWRNCTFTTNIPDGPQGHEDQSFRFYYTPNATLDGCHLYVHQNENDGSESGVILAFRDSSLKFTLNRDTLVADGSGRQNIFITHGGNIPGTVNGGVVDSCYFSNTKDDLFIWQDGIRTATVSYSTFVAQDPGVTVFGVPAVQSGSTVVVGPNSITHCTFAGNHSTGPYNRGAVSFLFNAGFSTDTTKFYSNIIYSSMSAQQNTIFKTCSPCNTCSPPITCAGYSTDCGLYLEIGGTTKGEQFFKTNWNLYQYMPYKTVAHDRAGGVYTGNGYDNWIPGATNHLMTQMTTALSLNAAADSTARKAARLKSDSLSVFGDAAFGYGLQPSVSAMIETAGTDAPVYGLVPVDGSFDPHIGASSAARGMAKDSTDAGAVAYALTPQAQILSTALDGIPVNFKASATTDTAFVVKNSGSGTLTATLSVSGSEAAGISLGSSSLSLTNGQRTAVSLAYTSQWSPTHSRPGLATYVVIATNDPALPTIRIPIKFNVSSTSSTDQ